MLLRYHEILFECISCGFCCRDNGRHIRKIVLTPMDADIISKSTRLSLDEFCIPSHQVSAPFFRIMKKNSGSCIFLDDNSKCKVYDSRPMICRCYPFPVEFDDQGVIFHPPSKDCPGIGRGDKLDRQFFEKLAKEVIDNYKSCSKMGTGLRSQ
jgi:Fe-S-cluster containining protein